MMEEVWLTGAFLLPALIQALAREGKVIFSVPWPSSWGSHVEIQPCMGSEWGAEKSFLPPASTLPPNRAVGLMVVLLPRKGCSPDVPSPTTFLRALLWLFGVSRSYSDMGMLTLLYSPEMLSIICYSNRSSRSTRDLASLSVYCSRSGQS